MVKKLTGEQYGKLTGLLAEGVGLEERLEGVEQEIRTLLGVGGQWPSEVIQDAVYLCEKEKVGEMADELLKVLEIERGK